MPQRKLSVSDKPLYGNMAVQTPSGEIMFRTNDKRANWYLKRGLAEAVDEKTIRLLFEPAGVGALGTGLADPRENRCCVCGATEGLTRHHVVPSRYRRHFSPIRKNAASEDIMATCETCHVAYEAAGDAFSKALHERLGIPMSIKVDRKPNEGRQVGCRARALLLHGDVIPEDKKTRILASIEAHLGREPKQEDIQALADSILKLPGRPEHSAAQRELMKKVVDAVGEAELARLWREHFQQTMKPRFMPAWWSPDMDFSAVRKQLADGLRSARAAWRESHEVAR